MKWWGPISAALVINVALFWLMQQMVIGRQVSLNTPPSAEMIDFIRGADQSETVQPRRQRTPPPPPEKPEPMPQDSKIKPLAESQPQPMPIPMSALKLADMSPSIDIDGPYLGPVLSEQDSQGLSTGGMALVMGRDMVAVHRRLPRYPIGLKRRKIEGYVAVEFTVNEKGWVEDPVIRESEPQGAFDRAVLRAIKKWKFQPRRQDGKIIAVRVYQRVVFSLDNQ